MIKIYLPSDLPEVNDDAYIQLLETRKESLYRSYQVICRNNMFEYQDGAISYDYDD